MRAVDRQVFLSHASADAELAASICEGLESRGVSCWIAPRDVSYTDTYGPAIERGVRQSEVFVILVSPTTDDSDHVQREAVIATETRKRIVPIMVGMTAPGPRLSYWLAGWQRFACPERPDPRFFDNLAAAIRGQSAPAAAAAPARSSAPRKTPNAAVVAVITAVFVVGAFFVSQLVRNAPKENKTPPPSQPSPSQPQPSQPLPSQPSPSPSASTNPSANEAPRVTRERVPPVTTAEPRVTTAEPRVTTAEPRRSEPPPSPAAGGTLSVNSARLAFKGIQAGEFVMGCSAADAGCEDDERPTKRVRLAPFQISTTEVTQALWEAVTGANPSDFVGSTLPVEHVSWQDAQDFVERLNGRNDGFRYRLPTESEWEYAARAGGEPVREPQLVAWFGLSAGGSRSPRTQPVATKAANAWGIYDLLGNVAEWCEDWYSPNYQRVIRGGSWTDGPRSVRVSARGKAVPTTRDYSIGLRIVREPL